MIKLIYSCVLGIIAGTCFAYSVKAAQCRFVTYYGKDGKFTQCTVCVDSSGNENWNCI